MHAVLFERSCFQLAPNKMTNLALTFSACAACALDPPSLLGGFVDGKSSKAQRFHPEVRAKGTYATSKKPPPTFAKLCRDINSTEQVCHAEAQS